MQKIKFILVSAGFLSILLFISCKKDEEPICDPCINETEVKADFGMMNGTSLTLRFVGFYPDVAFAREFITFKATPEDPEATYTWYLGTEVINGSSFQRDFSPTIITGENNIPVTMVMRKPPNKECFPNDDGYDSITKTITLIDDYCDYLTNGDFKVLFKGATDSSMVRVRNWNVMYPGYFTPDCDQRLPTLIGFDGASKTDTSWSTYGSGGANQFYSQLVFTKRSTTIDAIFNGSFIVDPDNHAVSASYQIFRSDGTHDTYSFKGRKIN